MKTPSNDSQARLLWGDKPNGAKVHSSGEINLPSSQPMLARIGVATDANAPRRPSAGFSPFGNSSGELKFPSSQPTLSYRVGALLEMTRDVLDNILLP